LVYVDDEMAAKPRSLQICRRRRRSRLVSLKSIAIPLAVAASLAGCAVESPIVENLLVVPGYYDTLTCLDLVRQFRGAEARVKELTSLMEKTSGSAGGPVVNALAYNTEYAKARAVQKYTEEAGRRKSCDFNQTISAPAPPHGPPPPNRNPFDLGMPGATGR
jgi:hypothetical protein